MYNPTPAEIAELTKATKDSPLAKKHVADLLQHFSVAIAKLAFYEKDAHPEVIQKALNAALSHMSEMDKAVYLTKAAGSQRGSFGEGHRLVTAPTAEELAVRETLAKRAATAAPADGTTAGGMAVSDRVMAAMRGVQPSAFRLAGMAQ